MLTLVRCCPFLNEQSDNTVNLRSEALFHTNSGALPPPPPPPGSFRPSSKPTSNKSSLPSTKPTTYPTVKSSITPSTKPTYQTTAGPTISPTTSKPTSRPTTLKPITSQPTTSPTTFKPTSTPSVLTTPLSVCKKSGFAAATATKATTCFAYKSILADFTALLPAGGNPADDFTRSNIFAKALRLAFHDAGEIDITQPDKLGPDGCLSNTAANAGLIPFGATTSTLVDSLFEPIFQKYCDSISRADFWALLGWLSINLSSNGAIPISFQYGRKDAVTCSVPRTRLPDAQLGRGAINQVFIAQMGLTLTDAVTLIGAHTIGHAHPSYSGYGTAPTPTTVATTADLQTNAWDTTPQTFDNQYYRSLIAVKWVNRGDVITSTNSLTDWLRGPTPNIMLNSDMVLAYNSSTVNSFGVVNQNCGPYTPAPQNAFVGCQAPTDGSQPNTVSTVQTYAGNNAAFLSAFAVSFKKMLSVGYGASYSNKLGAALVDLDLSTC